MEHQIFVLSEILKGFDLNVAEPEGKEWKYQARTFVEIDYMKTPIGRAQFIHEMYVLSERVCRERTLEEITRGSTYVRVEPSTKLLIIKFCIP